MVFSYYLTKFPYQCTWHMLKYTKLSPAIAAYCAENMDYEVLAPVVKHLPAMPYLAKNKAVAQYLDSQQKAYKRLPVFPQAVMMARHATWKFPERKIQKIGFRHGAYHFKKFIKAESYNAFDVFFMTSEQDNNHAKKLGIHSGVPIGYPKLDSAFDGTWTDAKLTEFSQHLHYDADKPTVMFSATWDLSGMSAVDKWCEKITEYSEKFNILVTLHPFTASRYKRALMQNPQVNYIESPALTPYYLLADVLVGDYSSILADFCALNKPIITFKVPPAPRSLPEITELISSFSLQIEHVDALEAAIDASLQHPTELAKQRKQANEIMFYKLDGKAGLRAAEFIKNMLNS